VRPVKVLVATRARPTDAVAVGLTVEQAGATSEGSGDVPWDHLRAQGFTGQLGQCTTVPIDGRARLFVGLGAAAGVDASALRSATAVAARAASWHRSLAVELSAVAPEVASVDAVRAQAEGAVLGGYRFAGYRTKASDAVLSEVRVVVAGSKVAARVRAAAADGARLAEAAGVARDLVNEPGGTLTPAEFARRARSIARAGGVTCTVHDERGAARLGLGGLLAVNQGSALPPRFVELAWDPPGAGRGTPTVALVGKGITFDSGGLSLKTAEGMTNMKDDMGGGAAVLAALGACRDLGVAVRVRGYIPLTDNMTGGAALRVGDVVTHYGGSTTEVLNTDAEGRLILADGLALATAARRGQARPDAVIDIATLTGACMVALGTRTAGLWADDDALADRLLAAGDGAGERWWRMPLVDAERPALDSRIADRKNVAGGRYGGAIVAALFLRDFVARGVPWAHLDIAGPAFNAGSDELEAPAGGTGFGVRTLLGALTGWS
jgi:leucyl aminopeptidase